MISFTVDRQPFNPGQPADVICAWMYGLSNDQPGNYIKKPMIDCTGDEILAELCYHLGLEDQIADITSKTIVRTALMPYVNAFFQPYGKDDRPQIMPAGVTNLALMGQFVDMVNDCSFTVESSVRTARIAVAQSLGLAQIISDVAPTQYDMRLFLQAARAMNNMEPSELELALRPHLEGTYFEDILPPAAETSEAEGF